MEKRFRLRVRKDFLRAARSEICFRTNSVVVQACHGGYENFRAGFTATKKIGSAVVRNTCKRRMREAARRVLHEFGIKGIDYVFIARKITHRAKWDILLNDINSAILFLNRKVSRNDNTKSSTLTD